MSEQDDTDTTKTDVRTQAQATSPAAETDERNTLLASALAYAARGWRVFPLHTPNAKDGRCSCGRAQCASIGKHPRVKGGLKAASNREAVIRAWWGQWPTANIGLVTGSASGLVALDIDSRHGGLASLATLLKRADAGDGVAAEMPDTLTANTGGGGAHLVFRHPGPDILLRNTTRLEDLDGLDVRGDGGYIVVAPSLHASGARYAWQDADAAPAALPDWLYAILTKPRGGASSDESEASGPRSERDRRAQDVRTFAGDVDDAATGDYWLGKALDRAVEGTRNDTGFWLACQLRDAGLAETVAASVLMDYAARVPGAGSGDYDEREALASLRQAYHAPSREPARSSTAHLAPVPAYHAPAYVPAYAPDAVRGGDGEWAADDAEIIPHPALAERAGTAIPEPPAVQGGATGRSVQAPATRFRLLTLADVMAMPATTWLVNGILPANLLSVVFGEYASGKSFLTIDLAMCIATGKAWHGHKVRQGGVVYIAAEGLTGLRKRLRAWQQHHDVTADADVPLYVLGSAPQLLRPGDVAAFAAAIRNVPNLQLVVIDTLSRALVGGDENSQKDMGIAVATADYIRSEFGCHVLFVHHKPNATPGTATTRTRGSSALPGAADTLIDVQKDSNVISVRCTKQKDTEEFRTLRFELRKLALDEQAHETSCVLVPWESRTAEADAQSRMLAALEHLGGSASYTDWQRAAEQVDVRRSTFAYHLGKLEASGRVTNDGGTWMLASPSLT